MAWSEDDYKKRGMGRLNLRLPLEVLLKLRFLAASANQDKKNILQELITTEHKKVFEGK
ncbi:MAG TPA: hypothetical protein VIK01_18825 [Polyangiaceae bacterium]